MQMSLGLIPADSSIPASDSTLNPKFRTSDENPQTGNAIPEYEQSRNDKFQNKVKEWKTEYSVERDSILIKRFQS